MKRILVSVSEELYDAIEKERKLRKLETVPEAARVILSDHFRFKEESKSSAQKGN